MQPELFAVVYVGTRRVVVETIAPFDGPRENAERETINTFFRRTGEDDREVLRKHGVELVPLTQDLAVQYEVAA